MSQNSTRQPYEQRWNISPDHPDRLEQPLRWKKPRRIFVNSMSDLFHEDVPDEFITAVFGIMGASPQHTFQVLTKRPERMFAWLDRLKAIGGLCRYIRSIRVDGDRTLPNLFSSVARTEIVAGQKRRALDDPWMQVFNAAGCICDPLPNVWLGVSVEDQATADERIPLLLQTPTAVRFLNVEPLLEAVELTEALTEGIPTEAQCNGPNGLHFIRHGAPRVDWVIVGGETGAKARPCNIEWIRSIIAQCRDAGVPVFCKQLGKDWRFEDEMPGGSTGYLRFKRDDSHGGNPAEWPEDLRIREFPG